MSKPMTFLAETFDWPYDAEQHSGDIIIRLDDERRAVIELTTSVHAGFSTSDHWTGVDVSIVSKTAGKIESKLFLFDDVLPTGLAHRTDGRSDYPLGSNRCFELIGYARRGADDWYIAHPANPSMFSATVMRWVDLWR